MNPVKVYIIHLKYRNTPSLLNEVSHKKESCFFFGRAEKSCLFFMPEAKTTSSKKEFHFMEYEKSWERKERKKERGGKTYLLFALGQKNMGHSDTIDNL